MGSRTIAIIIVLAVVAGAGAAWYWGSRPRDAGPPPPVSAEAKAYVRNLALTDVQMKAMENYTGAAVVEILGNISNRGDRAIRRVELTCIFRDPYQQEVTRERVAIVKSSLTPGETRSFRLPFEGLPETWNQAMPQMVIAGIEFAR